MTIAVSHPFLDTLIHGGQALPAARASWLDRRRAVALERANALAVPTIRDEDWRFTDLAPLRRLACRAPAAVAGTVDVVSFAVPEAAVRLVLVDGVAMPDLVQSGPLPPGVTVCTLAAALKDQSALTERHLTQHAGFERRLFTALNTAWLRDGALIHVARGVSLDAPLHVLYVSTRADAAACPRCLVVVEDGAQCTVIEDFVSVTDQAYFNNAVTEIAIARGAQLRHVRAQRESVNAVHIGGCAVALGKDASYQSQSLAFGARLSRYELDVLQQGEGAQAQIDGLALIGGQQVADTHSTMDHAFANGQCSQLHKTIVDGEAHAVFNGKVLVRKGAQLTNSAQQSRNLLLSSKARVDTKPQLEIFADDVKCAHGATVGQLDAEQLFYLKSRGLPDARARALLTYAFGAEIVDRVPVKSLVAQFERAILARTARDR